MLQRATLDWEKIHNAKEKGPGLVFRWDDGIQLMKDSETGTTQLLL